jgi:NAD+ diphosphatase
LPAILRDWQEKRHEPGSGHLFENPGYKRFLLSIPTGIPSWGCPFLTHMGKFSVDPLISSYPEPAMIPAAAQWVIVRGDGVCFTPGIRPSVLYPEDPRASGVVFERSQYLGYRGKIPYYAGEIGRDAPVPEGTEYSGIRDLFGRIPDDELAIAAFAVRIIGFDRTTRFCGRCGKETRQLRTERSKQCGTCGLVAYPRLSPAIIVLVQRDDRILLARSPHFPPGMFGLVAGFVEPYENLEHALVRKVKEEVGIAVENIRYFGSEPWPFPNSLMMGFTADFAGGELVLDKNEIESAYWFDRKHLPRIPEKLSISRALIDWWVEKGRR